MTINSPRISSAVFDDGNREYMFIDGRSILHVIARPDFDLEIHSNLSFSAVDAADDWVREVAKDVAELYGADESVTYQIICDAL